MPEPSELRISDEEREAAAREIREHFAAGRLTEDELAERIHAVYSARTTDQLRALRADLPALPPSPAQQRAELVQRRRHLQRRLIQQTGGALGVFVLCTVIWAVSGAHGAFWPIWIAIFPLLALLQNGWRLYGPAPELDRVERELERRSRSRDRSARDRSSRRHH